MFPAQSLVERISDRRGRCQTTRAICKRDMHGLLRSGTIAGEIGIQGLEETKKRLSKFKCPAISRRKYEHGVVQAVSV